MLQCARKVRGVPTPQTIFVLFLLVAICQLLRRGDLKTLFERNYNAEPPARQLHDRLVKILVSNGSRDERSGANDLFAAEALA
jgi:hypothetical protein